MSSFYLKTLSSSNVRWASRSDLSFNVKGIFHKKKSFNLHIVSKDLFYIRVSLKYHSLATLQICTKNVNTGDGAW